MHTHKEERNYVSYDTLEASENGSVLDGKNMKRDQSKDSSEKNLLKNWPLMSSIIVYCVFSFHDMAYTEVSPFMMWFRRLRWMNMINMRYMRLGIGRAIFNDCHWSISCMAFID